MSRILSSGYDAKKVEVCVDLTCAAGKRRLVAFPLRRRLLVRASSNGMW